MKLKTVETQGFQEKTTGTSFDWNKFLDDRINRVKISTRDLQNAESNACSWVTCACGNQCAIIPRRGIAPKDSTLFSLGLEFADLVNEHKWTAAKKCLAKIEARSTEILNEIYKKDDEAAIAYLTSRGWTFNA